MPVEVVELRTKYFGMLQTPGKARLILVRGDSEMYGLSYMLQGDQHVAGREDGEILFPEDPWMSPRHANFVYDGDGQLVVKDEGSLNGVFLRIRGSAAIQPGDAFLCGEQLFTLQAAPEDTAGPASDQTNYYASPRKPTEFVLGQVLIGGTPGLQHAALGDRVSVGREECDLNFPLDVFMSGSHAAVQRGPGDSFTLIDDDSKNGTYLRVRDSAPLQHGDYLFMGKQLLRVEMTA